MDKKWLNSLFEFLPAPSAIFDGTETAALFNCDISPNFSSDGKHAKSF